jgi:uncharacterized protein
MEELPMVRVFDLECDLPTQEAADFRAAHSEPDYLGSGDTFRGRDAPVVAGYGMANYANIFKGRGEAGGGRGRPVLSLAEFEAMLARNGVEKAVVGSAQQPSNDYTASVVAANPDRFVGLARISPWDGMRGVRELERLVRDCGLRGLAMAAFRERIPANDRRYYPLYAKCVELDIPVRLYSSMSYATDRPYDLGHPRYLDDVACDFPELRIIAGLGGWPWVPEMVALARRHANLYVDTSAHRPRHLATSGSGWEMLLQFGNTLLQDKVMVGVSWLTIGESYETLIGEILALPLKDSVKEKWLYSNAARFFRVG